MSFEKPSQNSELDATEKPTLDMELVGNPETEHQETPQERFMAVLESRIKELREEDRIPADYAEQFLEHVLEGLGRLR